MSEMCTDKKSATYSSLMRQHFRVKINVTDFLMGEMSQKDNAECLLEKKLQFINRGEI